VASKFFQTWVEWKISWAVSCTLSSVSRRSWRNNRSPSRRCLDIGGVGPGRSARRRHAWRGLLKGGGTPRLQALRGAFVPSRAAFPTAAVWDITRSGTPSRLVGREAISAAGGWAVEVHAGLLVKDRDAARPRPLSNDPSQKRGRLPRIGADGCPMATLLPVAC